MSFACDQCQVPPAVSALFQHGDLYPQQVLKFFRATAPLLNQRTQNERDGASDQTVEIPRPKVTYQQCLINPKVTMKSISFYLVLLIIFNLLARQEKKKGTKITENAKPVNEAKKS